MEITVAEDAGAGCSRGPDRRPDRLPFLASGRAEVQRRIKARQPFEKESSAGLQGELVIGEQRPTGAVRPQHIRRGLRMQRDEHICRGVIQRRFVRAVLYQAGVEVIAEVFQHGETGAEVGGHHGRCGKTEAAQIAGARDKGLHPAGGQSGQGIVAKDLACAGIRVWRTGMTLHRRRLIHQDQRRARRCIKSLIPPCGRIPGQRLTARVAETGIGQKASAGVFAISGQSAGPVRRATQGALRIRSFAIGRGC